MPRQPSLPQVIRVLRRVDPALGNLAETVSKDWQARTFHPLEIWGLGCEEMWMTRDAKLPP